MLSGRSRNKARGERQLRRPLFSFSEIGNGKARKHVAYKKRTINILKANITLALNRRHKRTEGVLAVVLNNWLSLEIIMKIEIVETQKVKKKLILNYLIITDTI